MYDTIIIGSGISGLYLANNLKGNVCILEKEDRIGGRIYTVCEKDICMEAGAGRLNKTHKLFLNLIEELGLKSKLKIIDGNIEFIPSGKYESKYISKNPFDFLDIVIEKGNKMREKSLKNKTFLELCEEILSKSDVKFILDSFGYYEQLISMNAYNALKLIDRGMHSKNTFYGLKGGMSQIIDELEKRIKHPIYTNCEVEHITYQNDIFYICIKGNKSPMICKKCICALPKKSLEKIPYFYSMRKLLNSVGIKVLCRIYSVFKKEDVWFKKINKTTTNNNNRYIIPIDKEKGLIMIAYTDSKYAKTWSKMNESDIECELQKNIKRTFGLKIAKPILTKGFYWETGTAFWKSGYNSELLSKKILHPNEKIPLFICGENYSESQGWIEGAIETSREILNLIEK